MKISVQHQLCPPVRGDEYEAIIDLVSSLTQLSKRHPKMSTLGSWVAHPDAVYDRLINEWIPNQPDSSKLMELFIRVGFSPLGFVYALSGRLDEWILRGLDPREDVK